MIILDFIIAYWLKAALGKLKYITQMPLEGWQELIEPVENED